MLYTAPCPVGHTDAEWTQLPSATGASPYRYEIWCRPCDAPMLPTTSPHPAAVPPVQPLVLRGYRWLRAVLS